MRPILILLMLTSLGAAAGTARADDGPMPAEDRGGRPRKVLLIAGEPDKDHPRGTHEYEKTARLLRHCLENAANLRGVRAEVRFHGWPPDEADLDTADAIVLISSGADRREQDHPLLVGDRMKSIERQMRRGCGLVLIHWATFVPNAPAGERLLEWVGGHFDYQSGPTPRRWASAIQDLETTARPADPAHPICRGVAPFPVHEEFYYRIRFRDGDPRLRPVLRAAIPGEAPDPVVAWAVERADGGRGFGFTGGHYFANWWKPDFRRLVLNAIAWAAGAEVPAGGVDATPPAPETFDAPPGAGPPVRGRVADPDWTPRPATGKAEPWEKATDVDWVDARFRRMDTGPFLDATFRYEAAAGPAYAYKGTAIRVGGGAVLFDRNQVRLASGWTGGYLDHSDRRFGLMNTPSPAGPVAFASASGPGWADASGAWQAPGPPTAPLPRGWARYRGLYLHGDRVVLSYSVGEAAVLDAPWAEDHGGMTVFRRDLEVGPSARPLRLLACDLAGEARRDAADGVPLIAAGEGDGRMVVALAGAEGRASLHLVGGTRAEVEFPPAAEMRRVRVLIARGPDAAPGSIARLARDGTPPDPAAWTRPGPARWTEEITTRGEVAPDDTPYVVDTLTVPYDNPYHALMFLSALDFLPDGSAAVCTAHGDVWLVRGIDATLGRLTWKRFATGLYQPLGLKVVGGIIHVLERGQLTRLHDRNGDGEADFYENVNSDWHTGAGEHSFDTCLETDPQGRFYFFKTGEAETPTGGCLLRVAADGHAAEVFATGFRHPIGLSVGPDGTVTGADQEGNWMPATRIDQYRPGGFYGDLRTHHRATPPELYDGPLCWLPREVDNSAGGQVWAPAEGFGPLSGHLLHLSYGRCKLFVLLRQEVDGLVQGGAADTGLGFLSGVKAGRFRPADGLLYVAGLTGWQTSARRDGCLQRVRYTGRPSGIPVVLAVYADGVRLGFARELDPRTAEDPTRYRVARWNYHWSADYGSSRWSVLHPDREGQDDVAILSATLLEDRRSVFLRLEDVRPVMQMQLGYNLEAADGAPLAGLVTHTVHRAASPRITGGSR
jgi:type 1 glutamine amidotransferase